MATKSSIQGFSTSPVTRPGQVLAPQRGEAVWVVINDRPAKRYFVEFFGSGARLAFTEDLRDVTYRESLLFYAKESDIVQGMVDGRKRFIANQRKELEHLQIQLDSLLAKGE